LYWSWQQLLPLSKQQQQRPWDVFAVEYNNQLPPVSATRKVAAIHCLRQLWCLPKSTAAIEQRQKRWQESMGREKQNKKQSASGADTLRSRLSHSAVAAVVQQLLLVKQAMVAEK